ncbi:MAG: protein kinase domain-containing protein [Myxococcota bacterium]
MSTTPTDQTIQTHRVATSEDTHSSIQHIVNAQKRSSSSAEDTFSLEPDADNTHTNTRPQLSHSIDASSQLSQMDDDQGTLAETTHSTATSNLFGEDTHSKSLELNDTAAFTPKHHPYTSPVPQSSALVPPPIPPQSNPEVKYVIGDELGKGGMGAVYQVEDTLLERRLAMKVLHDNLMTSADITDRFLAEARLTAQLQHPGIVPVHDMGTLPDGRVFFTMREVKGRSFQEYIQSVHQAVQHQSWQTTTEGWNLKRLIQTFRQICSTMAYAHAQGVVHCDLKPSNIMVGEFGEVLIVDWGIARRIWNPIENPDRIEGTPAYMAPEQAVGMHDLIDTRTDVYALGVILFSILCGHTPYQGYSIDQILNHLSTSHSIHTLNHLGKRPDNPDFKITPKIIDRHQSPAIPLALIEICEQAMERDRLLRYPNAGALAEAVQSWLDGTEQRTRALKVIDSAEQCLEEAVFLEKKGQQKLRETQAKLAKLPDWEAEEKKFPLWKEEEAATDMLHKAAALRAKRIQYLEAALTHKPDLIEAHEQLLLHYLEIHRTAEANGEPLKTTDAAERIGDHIDHLPINALHRKEAEQYLSGMGRLTIKTHLPVAVTTITNVHQYRRFHETNERVIGETPIQELLLPIGSYTLLLKHKTRPMIRLPVMIDRSSHTSMTPPKHNLPHIIEIPEVDTETECYVPAGWFDSGGDELAIGGLPRQTVWIDGFVIQKHPVTHSKYLQFLNHLAQNGQLSQAFEYSPRENNAPIQEDGGLYGYTETEGFHIVPDADGDLWDPMWPVFLIDHASATAYGEWASEQSGKAWMLPSELEWEKAARGVDRRSYPWGNGFEATWACMRNSIKGFSMPSSIDSFPVDTSPYGVRHMAGNLCEWTRTVYHEEGALIQDGREVARSEPENQYRVFKGGSWINFPNYLRSASRYRSKSSDRYRTIGFRLVRRVD